jgi:hypothetical protein
MKEREMKTQSIELYPVVRREGATVRGALLPLKSLLGLGARAFLALVPALAVVVGTAWLVTVPDWVMYLQATTWAAGFVFLGLALESERAETALFLSATGVALPVLAYLSSTLAVELAIVAATLVAAWIAAALLRRP